MAYIPASALGCSCRSGLLYRRGWTRKGLTRYSVFFVIDLATRTVEIAGISSNPTSEWMVQLTRNLTDPIDGFLRGKRLFICDRDPLYTKEFRELMYVEGVHVLRLPSRSPDLNAYAERFVRSIKEECMNRLIIIGERHLRYAIDEYVQHYHLERNHQGLENQLIFEHRRSGLCSNEEEVACRERLGGLLKFYHRRQAA